MIDEQQIRKIVESVVASVAGSSGLTKGTSGAIASPAPIPKKPAVPSSAAGIRGNEGVFVRMEDAINASKRAFDEFAHFAQWGNGVGIGKTQTRGKRGIGVRVNSQHAPAGRGECLRQQGADCRLAYPALPCYS